MGRNLTKEKSFHSVLVNDQSSAHYFGEYIKVICSRYDAQLVDTNYQIQEKFWDFKIQDHLVTIHFQDENGISLYPTKRFEASKDEIKLVNKVAKELKRL